MVLRLLRALDVYDGNEGDGNRCADPDEGDRCVENLPDAADANDDGANDAFARALAARALTAAASAAAAEPRPQAVAPRREERRTVEL